MTHPSGPCCRLMLLVSIAFLASCGDTHDHQPGTGVDEAAHAHDHHQEHALHGMSLAADGRRWATDAALREGMQRIRNAVSATLAQQEASGHDPARNTALAQEVDEAVAFLFANCRLEPEADANLHVLLARVMAASAALRTDSVTGEGLVGLLAALDDYPRYFDHPGWEGLPQHHH